MDSIGVIYDAGIINTITKFVRNKLNDDNIRVAFPNALLREDVLELLDRYCTVVYYPLYNESNNGFHINLPQSDGDKCHFCFYQYGSNHGETSLYGSTRTRPYMES